ncbi:hypothetical protein Tco_1088102, partial [Tanacetum coccineum]
SFLPAQAIPMTAQQQAQLHAFGPIGPLQPVQFGSPLPLAQQGPPHFSETGTMMFLNYAMSSSHLPQATMLPHAF